MTVKYLGSNESHQAMVVGTKVCDSLTIVADVNIIIQNVKIFSKQA